MKDRLEWNGWERVGVPVATERAWEAALGRYVGDNVSMLLEYPDFDWRATFAGRYMAIYEAFNGSSITSPIEQVLLGWLVWMHVDWLSFPDTAHAPYLDFDAKLDPDEAYFGIGAQVKVNQYRVDFLVVVHDKGGTRRLAVECDGHDYHEKTKEQAARDKKRDRDILALGIPTMRFTGSEIWKDPAACAEQIRDWACDMASDVLRV